MNASNFKHVDRNPAKAGEVSPMESESENTRLTFEGDYRPHRRAFAICFRIEKVANLPAINRSGWPNLRRSANLFSLERVWEAAH